MTSDIPFHIPGSSSLLTLATKPGLAPGYTLGSVCGQCGRYYGFLHHFSVEEWGYLGPFCRGAHYLRGDIRDGNHFVLSGPRELENKAVVMGEDCGEHPATSLQRVGTSITMEVWVPLDAR